MPTSARKSSLGARRAQQKAHVPYRGDNPQVGKKTGIPVDRVQRMSDGFEPFENIMSQADNRTPPHKRRRRPQDVILEDDDDEDEDDENGEMSMDIESPIRYATANRQRYSPVISSRPGSSSRPVPRSSDVDYDSVPGPRSAANGRKLLNGRPSRLSKSFNARQMEDEDDDDEVPFEDSFQTSPQDDFDPPPPMDMDDDDQASNVSMMDMNDDVEEEDEVASEIADELPQITPVKKPTSKGKQKVQPEPDPEFEEMDDLMQPQQDDIQMDDEEEEQLEGEEQEEEEQEETPRPRKNSKGKAKETSTSVVSRSKRESRPVPAGVRRSKRTPMAPLEWWRLERVVYGRPTQGKCLLPHVKEVIRIPKEDAEPLGGNKKRKRAASKKKSEPPESAAQQEVVNGEEGWDDDTGQVYKVLNFPFKEEVERRVCFPARYINPQEAANADWKFQKIFGDGDFIAAGQLVIPPRSRKPSKMTKDNTYIFYVIEGAVNLKVHETSMILCTGASFMVPRGNTYFIENIGDRDAKLFFTQARKTYEEEELLAAAAKQREREESQHAGTSKTPQPMPRSSSAGLPSGGGAGGGAVKRAKSSKV